MKTLDKCPVCAESSFDPFLTCKDYTSSGKVFDIVKCQSCGFTFTNPRPEVKDLWQYYKSEEYISHTDSNKGSLNRLYQLVRKYTLLKKLQLVVKLIGRPGLKHPLTLLDIGCGTGAFLAVCKNAGFSCTGIEPDPDARNLAIKNSWSNVMDETELGNLQPGSFNLISLWHVLEHVPDLNQRIEQVKELLMPTGRVIIAVPNRNSYDAKLYQEFWAAYDLPRHLYHFTPDTIRAIFEKHKMVVDQILPMRFDSFYVSLLSEKYRTGKLNYIKAIYTGIKSNISAIRSGNEFSSQIYILKKI